MRLADLDPRLKGTIESGALIFDCPEHGGHVIRVPLGAGGWTATGVFPDLSIQPSINARPKCPHFTITGGEIVMAND